MNVDRLVALIDFLLKSERSLRIQEHLGTLRTNLNNLASNPNQPQFQQDTAKSLNALQDALEQFELSLTPAQRRSIIEVKAYPFFSRGMADEIARSINKNGITPAVVQQEVNALFR